MSEFSKPYNQQVVASEHLNGTTLQFDRTTQAMNMPDDLRAMDLEPNTDLVAIVTLGDTAPSENPEQPNRVAILRGSDNTFSIAGIMHRLDLSGNPGKDFKIGPQSIVKDGESLVLGRGGDNGGEDIVGAEALFAKSGLKFPQNVSSAHCRISLENGVVTFKDGVSGSSTNGTEVSYVRSAEYGAEQVSHQTSVAASVLAARAAFRTTIPAAPEWSKRSPVDVVETGKYPKSEVAVIEALVRAARSTNPVYMKIASDKIREDAADKQVSERLGRMAAVYEAAVKGSEVPAEAFGDKDIDHLPYLNALIGNVTAMRAQGHTDQNLLAYLETPLMDHVDKSSRIPLEGRASLVDQVLAIAVATDRTGRNAVDYRLTRYMIDTKLSNPILVIDPQGKYK